MRTWNVERGGEWQADAEFKFGVAIFKPQEFCQFFDSVTNFKHACCKVIMQAAVLGEDAVAALSRAPPGNVVDCGKCAALGF